MKLVEMSAELAMAIDAYKRVERAERALDKAKSELKVRLRCLTKADIAEYVRQTPSDG